MAVKKVERSGENEKFKVVVRIERGIDEYTTNGTLDGFDVPTRTYRDLIDRTTIYITVGDRVYDGSKLHTMADMINDKNYTKMAKNGMVGHIGMYGSGLWLSQASYDLIADVIMAAEQANPITDEMRDFKAARMAALEKSLEADRKYEQERAAIYRAMTADGGSW